MSVKSNLTKTELLELLQIHKEEKQELLDDKNALLRTVNYYKNQVDDAMKRILRVEEKISENEEFADKMRSKLEDVKHVLSLRVCVDGDYFTKLIENVDLGYECGYANGYVGVKEGKWLFGKDYTDVNNLVFVHGGLTFSGHLEGEPSDIWWFGFDTRHSGDNPIDEDYKYCVQQTLWLLTQIVKIK